MQYCCPSAGQSVEPAFQLLTPLTTLLTLPAFLFPSLSLTLFVCSADGSAATVSVPPEVEVSFCPLPFFRCFCFCFCHCLLCCFVADHESPNGNSRRLLFDLNGFVFRFVLCDGDEVFTLCLRFSPRALCLLTNLDLLLSASCVCE